MIRQDFSLSSGSADYAKQLAKLELLQAREAELLTVLREPALQIHDPQIVPVRDPGQLAPYRRQLSAPPADSALVELLGDLAPAAAAAGVESDHAILVRLGQELAAGQRAMDVLREEMRASRLDASATICSRIRPEYQARAVAVAKAAAALATALGPYGEMASALRREGVAWGELGALEGVDDLSREVTPLSKLIKSAVDAGHLARLPRAA